MRRYQSVWAGVAAMAAFGLMVGLAPPAGACGGLVAPNGAVQLDRTTTLAAYHDGVEHYVTSFRYAGGGSDFGSIIPLPGVPSDVRRGGGWTLQRLEREAHPPAPVDRGVFASTAAVPSAEVLLQITVDALDITVLKGGGPEVLTWVKNHGYAVSDDAPAMLEFYARRSPIFLAARFDASKAAARQQRAGDGTPIQITIPTPNPWVPLHILTLAKTAQEPIVADVFLLTDRAPAVLGLDRGVQIQAGEPASASLLSDLRSDRESAWVPDTAWLTFVGISTTAGQLNHDLAIDTTGAAQPSAFQAGFERPGQVPTPTPVALDPIATPHRPINPVFFLFAAAFSVLLVALLVAWVASLRARRSGGAYH
ncbi:MAG: DUF2330 domain-containing protein [Actinomycetota bacterium]|nr:DUF2330 domain-containing protein [Actinomycetota bacterium]